MPPFTFISPLFAIHTTAKKDHFLAVNLYTHH